MAKKYLIFATIFLFLTAFWMIVATNASQFVETTIEDKEQEISATNAVRADTDESFQKMIDSAVSADTKGKNGTFRESSRSHKSAQIIGSTGTTITGAILSSRTDENKQNSHPSPSQDVSTTRRQVIQAGGIALGALTVMGVRAQQSIQVRLQPATQSVEIGSEPEIEIILDGATGGVAAYELELSLGSESPLVVTDAELAKEAPLQDINRSDHTLSIEAAQGANTYQPAENLTLATISLSASGEGTGELNIDTASLSDENNEQYTIGETTGATIQVTDDSGATAGSNETGEESGNGSNEEYGETPGTPEADAQTEQTRTPNIGNGENEPPQSKAESDDNSTDGIGPGFGVGSMIAALSAVSYALSRTE